MLCTKRTFSLLFAYAESSQAARHGGCFPPESTILTEGGTRKALSELKVGDRVQAVNEQGQMVYSPVLLFLDRDLSQKRDFVQLHSADGARITLTASHLVYTVAGEDLLEDVDLDGQMSNSIDDGRVVDEDENRLLDKLMANVTVDKILGSRLKATFASRVQIGDWVVVADPATGRLTPQRVVDISAVVRHGVLAPLTAEGTLVVDQVVVSCYAVIDDQSIAHWAFAPVRLLDNVQQGLIHFWRSIRLSSSSSPAAGEGRSAVSPVPGAPASPSATGVHWYAQMLYSIARYVLPSHLVYN